MVLTEWLPGVGPKHSVSHILFIVAICVMCIPWYAWGKKQLVDMMQTNEEVWVLHIGLLNFSTHGFLSAFPLQANLLLSTDLHVVAV